MDLNQKYLKLNAEYTVNKSELREYKKFIDSFKNIMNEYENKTCMKLKDCWISFKKLWEEYISLKKLETLDVELCNKLKKSLMVTKKKDILPNVSLLIEENNNF